MPAGGPLNIRFSTWSCGDLAIDDFFLLGHLYITRRKYNKSFAYWSETREPSAPVSAVFVITRCPQHNPCTHGDYHFQAGCFQKSFSFREPLSLACVSEDSFSSLLTMILIGALETINLLVPLVSLSFFSSLPSPWFCYCFVHPTMVVAACFLFCLIILCLYFLVVTVLLSSLGFTHF